MFSKNPKSLYSIDFSVICGLVIDDGTKNVVKLKQTEI